jgi:hypothetical protein
MSTFDYDRAGDTKLYYTEAPTKKLRKAKGAGVWHGIDGMGIRAVLRFGLP